LISIHVILCNFHKLPNISNVIAKNIVEIYPTYRELIYALDNVKNEDEDEDEEQIKKDRLALLTSIDKIGKVKSIIYFKILIIYINIYKYI